MSNRPSSGGLGTNRQRPLAAALVDLLRRVSHEGAAAILLREVFELDYSEIARVSGKTVAATRQFVHRALASGRAASPAVATIG